MVTPRHDTLIIGSGPAAWAAAAELSAVGIDVTLVAPEPHAEWVPNYGVWVDDWHAAGAPDTLGHVWPSVSTVLRGQRQTLHRAYAQVDKAALRAHLVERASRVTAIADRVVSTDGEQVVLASGDTLDAGVVIDASGARSPFLKRQGGSTGAVQTAWGELVDVDCWPWPTDTAIFMDFSGPTDGPASFLYAMPLSPQQVFVEETVLAASPAVPLEFLRRRLHSRLARHGVTVTAVHETEQCVIPMDPPRPVLAQPVVGFGAAASFVHPATGYTLLQTLTRAPALAAAIRTGLERGDADQARTLAWSAVWPRSARITNQLHRFGLRTLLQLDATETHRFFERFFALPVSRWSSYLRADGTPMEIAGSMGALFASADAPLRWHLATAGLRARPEPERSLAPAPGGLS